MMRSKWDACAGAALRPISRETLDPSRVVVIPGKRFDMGGRYAVMSRPKSRMTNIASKSIAEYANPRS